MQCNIDGRGRRVRKIGGWICCAAAVVFLPFAFSPGINYVPLSIGLALLVSGLFQLYEARKGWCALRAMGLKTPI